MEKFHTKKSLGQNFLNSDVVPRWLADAGDVVKGETVLEVGPGTGALTRELLARGAKVIALEADDRAITILSEEFLSQIESGQLQIHHTDVRELDLQSLDLTDHSFKVVANIPYYLTGKLFRNFLDGAVQPSLLVFLVQKEVAKRACVDLKRGEKESLLSLSIKAFGTPIYVRPVGKGHFTPAPKVDSAIIKVADIGRDKLAGIDHKQFFSILRLGFGQKRKQLLGNLASNYKREELINIFSTVGLSNTVRAEDVPLDKWLELTKELSRI